MALPLLFHNQGKGRPIGGGIIPTPVPPFSPTDLAGLILWLDGSDITKLYQDSGKTTPVTSDGDVVGAIEDKSGNGNDVTQAITANKPLYKTGIQNSLSSILFDGLNDYLADTFASGALSQPFHTIVVAQLDATQVNNGVSRTILDGTTNKNMFLLTASGQTPDAWGMHAGTYLYGGAADANWNIFTSDYNGASSDFRINGTQVGSGNAGIENPVGATVGSYYLANTIFWKGYISEILIYDPSLSDTDRDSLETYLSDKWDISITPSLMGFDIGRETTETIEYEYWIPEIYQNIVEWLHKTWKKIKGMFKR